MIPRLRRALATLRRWLRPPRRLAFTREGKYFVGIALGIGFAALNTGNNLLFLLLGMMLSLIVASGILSEMSLRDLDVRRAPPGRIFAGRAFLMGISLKNRKTRFPSFSVEVEDLIEERPLDKRCYFLKIPAGRLQQTSYKHIAPRRGMTRFTGFRISTKFPFALFRKSRLISAPQDVIVFPAIRPLAVPPPTRTGAGGDELWARKGRRGEFWGLREYRDGDDPRDVHWRSTARRGRAVVREHEDEAARRVTLYVDNALPSSTTSDAAPALEEALERAISLAASLAAHYLEGGFAVRVVARGSATALGSGPTHLAAVLRFLALLPTLDEETPFPSPPDPRVETVYVARRGAPRPTGFGQVIEA